MAHIAFDTGSAFGQHIRGAINAIRLAQSEVARAFAVANQIATDGGGATALEGAGPFNVHAGDGASFLSTLGALNAALKDATGSVGGVEAWLVVLDQG